MTGRRRPGGTQTVPPETLTLALDRLGEAVQTRSASRPDPTPAKPAKPAPRPSLRRPPRGDRQEDLFAPQLHDVGGRDARQVMDVAPFRLSKRDIRAGGLLRYDLPDGYIEVSSGHYGMATVSDYDLVIVLASTLTEAVNAHHAGRGEMPGRRVHLRVADVLRYCRRGDGARQAEEIEQALSRLSTTTVKSVREQPDEGGRMMRHVEAEGLIGGWSVVSRTDTGRISSVEIEAPRWIYDQITGSDTPDVLTVHPDYFLIGPGIARFLYRLARRAAGKTQARWLFQTIYQRSGSTGAFKKFAFLLRRIIAEDALPEYTLAEEPGQAGPVLLMRHRGFTPPALPERDTDADPDSPGTEGTPTTP